MRDDFRENYFKARKIVANELKERYKLVESYSDNERLTLDSSNYSIHLTFYVPDGKDLYITEKGSLPHSNNSFLAYAFSINQNNVSKTQVTLNEIYKPMGKIREDELYLSETIIKSYRLEIEFLQRRNPEFFL